MTSSIELERPAVHAAFEAELRALRRERDHLARMIALVPGAFVSYRRRPDGRVEVPFASPSIRELFGLTAAELVAEPYRLTGIIHPDDQPKLAAALATSARDQTPLCCEYRVRHPERGELWVELSSRVTSEPDGAALWHGVVLDVTARKRAQRTLDEERDRIACIAATAPGAISSFRRRVDGAYQFDYVTPGLERLYGISATEIQRDAYAALARIVPEDQARVHASIESSAATLAPWHCEFRIAHPERGEVWIDGRSAPVREPDGSVLWHGFLIDITESRRAEVAREREREHTRGLESRLRALVDAVPDFLILIDRDRHIGYINHLLPGFALDDVVGRPAVEFIDPATRGEITAALDAVFATGRAQSYEVATPTPDGTRWFNSRIGPVVQDGEVVGAILASSDLTDRRLAEEKLRGSESLLRSVLESVEDAIVTIDAAGRMISCNPATSKIFGYSIDELVGASVNLLMPEAEANHHDGYLAGNLTSAIHSIPPGRELIGRHKSGTRFPIEISVARFELAGAVHFTGVIRDITARKKLEDQFRQAHKMEAFGQLAGGVAHDFNNLLTVILAETDFVMSNLADGTPILPEALGESIREIHEAGQRASGLTRQLLAFSRKTVLEPKLVEVNQIVRDTEKMLKRLIGEDIAISTKLATHLPPIHVDPGQLGQVLMNLAVNARDAMPTGGRLEITTDRVTLAARDELAAGDYVRLIVRDTGVGMSPDVRDRVFQPFFTTKPVGKGTGLGLAVVHGIVTQIGGAVTVTSEPGHGTTFELEFPAAQAVHATTEAIQLRGHNAETVLVVEDDEAIRRLAERVLASKGFKVLTAGDGVSALALLESTTQPIDAVITDVVMPHMGGRELGMRIRERFPDAKLLYVSGYTDDMLEGRGLSSGQIDFLAKPYTAVTLIHALDRLLARPAPHDGPDPSRSTTKKRILFVDDEASILAALEAALAKDRKRWEMVFVGSGGEALRRLAEAPFDLVVTDMRMPEIDGAQLLERVRREFPSTVRLMLTGQADEAAIATAGPAIHELLDKPCDIATLRGTIDRWLGG